mmetsp:Transcript_3963/g.9654  ORF Transcript_3963/g.9654 Transcript_3963/m.9654 type:complete len:331 (-) Transcript_3963:183-1175(-)
MRYGPASFVLGVRGGFRLLLILLFLLATHDAEAAADVDVEPLALRDEQKWLFPSQGVAMAEQSFSCVQTRTSEWSYAEAEWCCLHRGMGCSASAKEATQRFRLQQLAALTTTPRVSLTTTPRDHSEADMASGLFDCVVDFDDWRLRWSADKAAWCCEHWHRACPSKTSTSSVPRQSADDDTAPPQLSSRTLTTSLPYKCDEEERSEWSRGKAAWCCMAAGRGCPQKAEKPAHAMTDAARTNTDVQGTTTAPVDLVAKYLWRRQQLTLAMAFSEPRFLACVVMAMIACTAVVLLAAKLVVAARRTSRQHRDGYIREVNMERGEESTAVAEG